MAHSSQTVFKSDKHRKKVVSLLGNRYEGKPTHLKGQQNLVEHVHERQDTAGLKASKKHQGLIKILSGDTVVLSEGDIQNIKNNLNSGNETREAKGEEYNDLIFNNKHGVRITEEQTSKGIAYLARANIQKQLGSREQHIVDNFKEFRLNGFEQAFNDYGNSWYEANWRVISNDGESFDYQGASKGIEITG